MENNQEIPRINWNYLLLKDHERFIYDMATLGREKTKEEKRIQLVTELLWHPFGFVKGKFRTLRRKTRNYVRNNVAIRVNNFLFHIAPKRYFISKSIGNYKAIPFGVIPLLGVYTQFGHNNNRAVRFKSMKHVMACYRIKTTEEVMNDLIKEHNDKNNAETQAKLNQLLSSGGIQNKEEM